MNIIQRNFFKLLCSGAFNTTVSIEPMSVFKWYKLFQMVDVQNVLTTFVKGVNNCAKDENMQLPIELIQRVQDALMERKKGTNIEKGKVRLSNKFLNRKLEKIIHRELHNIDTSIEAIETLKIIVYNTYAMLNRGISLEGIIRLGWYMRNKGDKIDFVKLEQWLMELHLQRIAQLQGCILIDFFYFEKDELPFVQNIEKETKNIMIHLVSNLAKDTTLDWSFTQNSAGFLKNNGVSMRKNIRRGFRYFAYAPLETTSNFVGNLAKSLSEIEE